MNLLEKKLSRDQLFEKLEYYPDLGVVKWLPRARELFPSDETWKRWNGRFPKQWCAGGYVRGYGRRLTFMGANYSIMDIAVMMHFGPIGDRISFPKDGNPDNIKLENISIGTKEDRKKSLRIVNPAFGLYYATAIKKFCVRVLVSGHRSYHGPFDDRDEAEAVGYEYLEKRKYIKKKFEKRFDEKLPKHVYSIGRW